MPQKIALDTTLFRKAAQEANKGVKKLTGPFIPDAAVDTLLPPDAKIEPSDLVSPLAVAIKPPAIARQHGEEIIRLLREQQPKGLIDKAINWLRPTKLNKAAVDSIEFVQKRYPRVFGHLNKVGPVNPDTPIFGDAHPQEFFEFAINNRNSPIGRRDASLLANHSGKALTDIRINPKYANKSKEVAAETMGHELLHAADGLTTPNHAERYNFGMRLPGGYPASAHEIRARLQGALMRRYLGGASRKAAKEAVENTPIPIIPSTK